MSFLKDIVEYKKAEIKELYKQKALDDVTALAGGRFYEALKKDPVNVIAEIKKASPVMGVIRKEVDIKHWAKLYEEAGANAISVLTEKHYFKGDLSYLAEVKQSVRIPVLRKDFLLDPAQLYEARRHGADAVLLIAAILPLKKLKLMMDKAKALGLDYLVEIHEEAELKTVLKTDCPVIGINNRNLKTFKINLGVGLKLAQKVPADRQVVIESGIKDLRDIQLFTEVGIRAFLIGKYLMEQNDPSNLLRAIKNASSK